MKKVFKAQSGRSMVEMLGVLAVIGVLSVGGIAGYRMAMDQHKANEMLHLINVWMTDSLATIKSGHWNRHIELNSGDFYASGGYYGEQYPDGFGSAEIKISNLTKGSCEKIVDGIRWDDLQKLGTNGGMGLSDGICFSEPTASNVDDLCSDTYFKNGMLYICLNAI